jgi:hypothetical protein
MNCITRDLNVASIEEAIFGESDKSFWLVPEPAAVQNQGIRHDVLRSDSVTIGEFNTIFVGIEDYALIIPVPGHMRSLQNDTPSGFQRGGQPVDFPG